MRLKFFSRVKRFFLKTTINPRSKFYVVWQTIVVLAVLAITLIHPYEASFAVVMHEGKIIPPEPLYESRN